jgi:hypothetical protein
MGTILDKIKENEARLQELEKEILEKQSELGILHSQQFKTIVDVLKAESKLPWDTTAPSDDFLCTEGAETYDLLDWFFIAHGGESIVEVNHQYAKSLTMAFNSIYLKGKRDGITKF